MKGKIQTVLGLIDPGSLGSTLTHEHLLHSIVLKDFTQPMPDHVPIPNDSSISIEHLPWIRQNPYSFRKNLIFNDESVRSAVKEEMSFYKHCKGDAVVDNCAVGVRTPDQAQYLKSLSLETGVHVIAGTGFYVADSQRPSTLKMGLEEMERQIRDDLLIGMGGSEVKCGVIGEVGCSWPLQDFERKSLSASAGVQQETGGPVIIHPGRDRKSPAEIMRVFLEAGGKCHRTVMSHLDRTLLEVEDLLEFAGLGTFCEFDLFGTEVSHYQTNEALDMPSDAQRVQHLLHLVNDGYGDKIVVSHDIHTKHRLMKFGGHGFSHILLNVVPKMKKRGFSDLDIEKILYINPKTWLTFE